MAGELSAFSLGGLSIFGNQITINPLYTKTILPIADNTYDVGSASLSYRQGHFETAVYATSVVGNWSPSAPSTYTLGLATAEWQGLYLGDDAPAYFGLGQEYWITYNKTGTQWELWGTDVNGSGTDGLIMSVDDGTDDVDFTGDIVVLGRITSGANIVSDTDNTDYLGNATTGWKGVYLATGHWKKGILLSTVTGRIITDLISEGSTSIPIEPFSITRFNSF